MKTSAKKTFPEPAAFSAAKRPPIQLLPVESSQVKAVGYCPETKTLAVQFKRGTGAVYHFAGIEPQEHADFLAAESIGRHFDAHIKSLPFEKFPPEPEAQAA